MWNNDRRQKQHFWIAHLLQIVHPVDRWGVHGHKLMVISVKIKKKALTQALKTLVYKFRRWFSRCGGLVEPEQGCWLFSSLHYLWVGFWLSILKQAVDNYSKGHTQTGVIMPRWNFSKNPALFFNYFARSHARSCFTFSGGLTWRLRGLEERVANSVVL